MRLPALLSLAALICSASALPSQQRDTSAARPDTSAAPEYSWRDSVRYGGGPSVGAPPSDFTGAMPPSFWCLQPTGRAPGDFGINNTPWMDASRSWLHQVLSDTTEFGVAWRHVLGGAPLLTPQDTIEHVLEEPLCRDIAALINRSLLGWQVGPPPVVVFRVRNYLIAYPSNARMGEFGLAVGMSSQAQIQGVATW